MKIKICKLTPKSSLHFGIREGFLEETEIYIHSDTLFSAFCNSYLLLYGRSELEVFLSKFISGNFPFVISSAFPYKEETFYFPIPENQIPRTKDLKKKLFVEKKVFEELINGKNINSVEEKNTKFIPNENETLYVSHLVPRIGIGRLTSHPSENYFHFGEIIYKKGAGLFFLFDIRDKDIENKFYVTIRLMAEEGIGGDRTVGKGFFKPPEFTEIDIDLPKNSQAYISLSLFSPTEDELKKIDFSKSFYQLVTRSGYVYSPMCRSLRKKSVRMFKEGSVFNSLIIGKVVEVTPENFNSHRVYRYGIAFSLPCVLDEVQ